MATTAEMLQSGFQRHRQGDLEGAEQWYRQVLAAEPANGDAWALLGAASIGRGRLEEAEKQLREALRLNSNHGGAHDNLGIVLAKLDRNEEAAVCFREALRLNSSNAETYMNLGNVLTAQGKLPEAEATYRRAIALRPNLALAHFQLANTLRDQKRIEEAVAGFRQALRLQPDDHKVLNNLGSALQELGKPEEAIRCFKEAIRIRPDYGRAYSNLGNAYRELGQLDEAVAYCEKALEFDPDSAEAQNTLGAALFHQGKVQEAVQRFEPAIQLKPGFANAYHNLGAAIMEQGKPEEALDRFRQAVRHQPDYATAHMSLGMVYLTLGKFEEGWPEYEWRWKTKDFAMRPLKQPRWEGGPLDGKTILLYAEQGLGDTLHFVRYVRLVKERGAKVILECQAALMRLLARTPGIDQFVAAGAELPPFDVHAPLLSLPLLFSTAEATIPADVPYVFPDPGLEQRWRAELKAIVGFKIGVNWQGNPEHKKDRYRSFPLERLGPIARMPGVKLISLQKGPGADQLRTAGVTLGVLDLGTRLDEKAGPFMDTAALMKSLDLVITSDTATAHLAGALGVPVWVALPFAPDWRWLLQRSDSPWYPTMRLLRQSRQGDWEGVFEAMAEALRAQMAGAPRPKTIRVEMAPGELIDKITILVIKKERITDDSKMRNILRELTTLETTRDQAVAASKELTRLTAELKKVNEALWEIEDAIRLCERDQDFGPRFIELARSVYHNNDQRAALKRQINELLGARFLEEKSYAEYKAR
jgi:tetratricopeptide (TPR) repeat protein